VNIAIVGLGQFGSALSQIYERQKLDVRHIHHDTPVTTELDGFLSVAVAILCVPTQRVPEVLEQRGESLRRCRAVVSTAKGIIQKSGLTARQYILKTHKNFSPVLILSGPSFASELRDGQPTAVVLAGAAQDRRLVDTLSVKLSTPQLRLYKCLDPYAVEISGAFKNVYAIAAGIAAGLGFGDNTRAALTTRALAELSRIGEALGGDRTTFFGLAGAGDLFLTCSSRQSRNFQFGMGLAKKVPQDELLKKLGTVEGLWTAKEAQKLCAKHKIRAPLLQTVVAIIENKLTPEAALKQLMTRQVRHEFE
jgi:glycerol-3-phosphate dehydrogenase (NAD(P)+)